MQKIREFISLHPDFFTFLGLSILFYFIFFHNIGTYALMDVDESRYVLMSKDMFNTKDFLTLYMNGEYFFEKPPLYFWGECLSFAIFGHINEFTARFPVALYGSLCAFLTYFVGKKIVSRTYGIVSSLILATSLEFTILSKFAILDIVVSTCVWFSLCFGILTYFCKEENKKYMWWLFYIFSGLAVMAKGIPGFVIPFGSMFFISIFSKNFKEIFKPKYFIVGFILFFLITIPWHFIMLKMHNPLFFNEYIMKHHIARFLGGNTLSREQPFYFYFVTLLWGFFPWIISCLAVLIRKIYMGDFVFKDLSKVQRFMVFNGIASLFILLFFSSSDTKLITYILPIYGPLACLGGYIWTKYVLKGEYEKIINVTVYITGGIFILASIIAIFTPLFLPEQLIIDIAPAKILCITSCFAFGLSSILFAKKKLYFGVFFSYVIFILILSAFGTQKFYQVDYKFGQDDLIKFAQYADVVNRRITTINFSNKFSLDYYSDEDVDYMLNQDYDDLQREINENGNLVIIQPKKMDMKKLSKINYKVILKGRKYSLIEKK